MAKDREVLSFIHTSIQKTNTSRGSADFRKKTCAGLGHLGEKHTRLSIFFTQSCSASIDIDTYF